MYRLHPYPKITIFDCLDPRSDTHHAFLVSSLLPSTQMKITIRFSPPTSITRRRDVKIVLHLVGKSRIMNSQCTCMSPSVEQLS